MTAGAKKYDITSEVLTDFGFPRAIITRVSNLVYFSWLQVYIVFYGDVDE